MDSIFIFWIAKQLVEDTGWNHYKARNTELLLCLQFGCFIFYSKSIYFKVIWLNSCSSRLSAFYEFFVYMKLNAWLAFQKWLHSHCHPGTPKKKPTTQSRDLKEPLRTQRNPGNDHPQCLHPRQHTNHLSLSNNWRKKPAGKYNLFDWILGKVYCV